MKFNMPTENLQCAITPTAIRLRMPQRRWRTSTRPTKCSRIRFSVETPKRQFQRPDQTDDLTHSILSAARAVILRNGWTVTHEENSLVLFETGNPRVRIALTDGLRKDSLLRISRQFREIVAVLAVQIEDPISSGMKITVIDLMHAQWHGAPVPDGPCKSLLSGFL